MSIAFILLIALPLTAIVALSAFSPRFSKRESSAHLSSIIFAVWLVSMVLFTPFTFRLQLGGMPDISVERMMMLCTVGAVIVRLYRHDVLEGQNMLIEVLMFFFSILCIVSMARFGFIEAHPLFSRPSFVFISGYLVPFFCFFFAKFFLDNDREFLVVFKSIFWLGVYLTVTAFLERSDFKFLVWPGYIIDPEIAALHLDRARGPFLNAAFNGMAINLAFICGLLVYPTLSNSKRWVYILFMILMVPAVYLTRTRSVYVHFLLTLLALMALYKTKLAVWRILPALALVLLVVVGANFEKLTSENREGGGIGQMKEVYIRLGLAEKSLNLLSENPFGGIGLAQFSTTSMFTPREVELQHNQLIGMAVELGLPGAGLYLAIILVIFFRLYSLLDAIPLGQFLNTNMVLLLSLVFFVCLWNAVFVEPTMHLFIASIFFVFAGIVDQLYNRYVLRRV